MKAIITAALAAVTMLAATIPAYAYPVYIPVDDPPIVEQTEQAETVYTEPVSTYHPTGVLTKQGGVNWYGDQKETYYNLDMSGVIYYARTVYGIEGEYWVREDGCKMYGDYIIVAANLDVHPRGSLVETSLGTGIVLDTGGFASVNPLQVDIAVDW